MGNGIETHSYNAIHECNRRMRAAGEESDFSSKNRFYLAKYLQDRFPCRSILEIGVENNPRGLTSTSVLLETKRLETKYFGVDILDRSGLDNPSMNVYTIQSPSEDIDRVMSWVRSHGIDEIDFLFIDGWHSVEQCRLEWDGYTPFLSKNGIVGFHDTNHHLGPRWLVENIDRAKWEVVNYPSDPAQDFGIGFAWQCHK